MGVDTARDILMATVGSNVPDDTENYFIEDSLDLESLEKFEDETRWNETHHNAGMLYCLAITGLLLESGLTGGVASFIGATTLVNGYLSAIQRYNRLRIQKVKDWLEGKEES